LNIARKYLSVLETEEWCGFACGALKLVWWSGASNDDFGGVWWFACFFEMKGYFALAYLPWRCARDRIFNPCRDIKNLSDFYRQALLTCFAFVVFFIFWTIFFNFIKLVNNSLSLNKGNHDRDGVWISDLNKHRFLIRHFLPCCCFAMKLTLNHYQELTWKNVTVTLSAGLQLLSLLFSLINL